MPAPPDICRLLYQNFVERLELDWPDHYADQFDGPYAENRHSIKFYQLVTEDIGRSVSPIPGIDRIPSRDTIRRILREERISERTQEHTFQALSHYLTGEDWDRFQQLAEEQAAAHEPAPEVNAAEVGIVSEVASRRPTYVRSLLIGLIVAFLAIGTWLCESDPSVPDEMDALTTIREANWHQMQAFKKVHETVDAEPINRFYGNVAARDLIGFLEKMNAKGTRLEQSRSSYDILDMEIIEQTDERVHVRTREHWLLRWDYPHQQDMIFDTINQHDYILLREGDRWVIEQDIYEGSAYPLRVPITPTEREVEEVVVE